MKLPGGSDITYVRNTQTLPEIAQGAVFARGDARTFHGAACYDRFRSEHPLENMYFLGIHSPPHVYCRNEYPHENRVSRRELCVQRPLDVSCGTYVIVPGMIDAHALRNGRRTAPGMVTLDTRKRLVGREVFNLEAPRGRPLRDLLGVY